MSYFLVFLGGGIGSVTRYLAMVYLPYPVFVVNIVGSFAITYFTTKISIPMQNLIIAGFLGGFTTFSAFSREFVDILALQPVKAFIYASVMLVVSLLAAIIGHKLGSL